MGYEIRDSLRRKAVETAKQFNLEDKIDFRSCAPDETLSIEGTYDAVFLKSVLYHISDKGVYREWLKWLHGVLRDGGVVIAIQNGGGGYLIDSTEKQLKKCDGLISYFSTGGLKKSFDEGSGMWISCILAVLASSLLLFRSFAG